MFFTFFFFFSSRRRHTRSKRDWSSDVCSSDLKQNRKEHPCAGVERSSRSGPSNHWRQRTGHGAQRRVEGAPKRSEERRVGKECRSRRGGEHDRKKGEE